MIVCEVYAVNDLLCESGMRHNASDVHYAHIGCTCICDAHTYVTRALSFFRFKQEVLWEGISHSFD